MAKLSRDLPAGQAGISLISVLVALALLATTAIALSRIIVTSTGGSRVSRETFIAAQLAREGLELIQAHRDTNWFKKTPDWTADLCNGGTAPVTVRFDSSMALAGQPEAIDSGTDAIKLYRTSSNQFVHQQGGNTDANYGRYMTIGCENKDADPAYINVTSSVTWQTRGVNHRLDLKERLFNWFTAP